MPSNHDESRDLVSRSIAIGALRSALAAVVDAADHLRRVIGPAVELNTEKAKQALQALIIVAEGRAESPSSGQVGSTNIAQAYDGEEAPFHTFRDFPREFVGTLNISDFRIERTERPFLEPPAKGQPTIREVSSEFRLLFSIRGERIVIPVLAHGFWQKKTWTTVGYYVSNAHLDGQLRVLRGAKPTSVHGDFSFVPTVLDRLIAVAKDNLDVAAELERTRAMPLASAFRDPGFIGDGALCPELIAKRFLAAVRHSTDPAPGIAINLIRSCPEGAADDELFSVPAGRVFLPRREGRLDISGTFPGFSRHFSLADELLACVASEHGPKLANWLSLPEAILAEAKRSRRTGKLIEEQS